MWSLSALVFLSVLLSAAPLSDPASERYLGIVHHGLFQQSVSQDISFEPRGAVHGITEYRCEFSKTGWGSSDGKVVFLEINYCKSPANAQRVLNRLVRKATKIFEKKTVTSKGRITKKRIVVTFSKDLIKRPEMILWTKGNEIYMVESSSFAHALIFEKRFPNV